MSAESSTGVPVWVRVQQAIGVGFAVFAGFHAWVQWPALANREAWLERVRAHGLGMGVGIALVGVLAVHAVLGFARTARARAGERGLDAQAGFQAVTGGLLLLFLVHHLSHVWPLPQASTPELLGSYERLWELLGQPLNLVSYMLGCGALACHVAHGLASLVEPRVPVALRTLLRYVAGVSAFALFVLYLQLVGRFALGEPMLPIARPGYAVELRE